ncbi:17-beta-hydroxysteroid dehydrogenase type 2 [Rana temporaria]|uniref:17-beta-hydroxysteroid dehydrogenase type 2 n=1 Tax=Rana temporaria TaxID=8407 RepID=UPI001AAC96AA|nr:17-beta-hydroxysteroid dehydrogenase type 2 [Rana temporaria]
MAGEDALYLGLAGEGALYLGLGALFSGLSLHKIRKNEVKVQDASLCVLPALLLLEAFCYLVLPAGPGLSVFFVACVFYYMALPVRRMLPAAGKSVLVTGCDSGLGHALAKHLDKQGLLVFAGVLNRNGPGAEELRRDCSPNLCLIQLDVTNCEEVAAAYCEVSGRVKDTGLWAIVHNAGVLLYVADGELLPMNVYKKCMEVNFIGVVQVTKMFMPLLRKAKGRLVTISSMAGLNPIPGFAAYAASKAAVTMFCAVMRQDLFKWGVKVSSIHPGSFKTNIFGSRDLCSIQAQNLLENLKPDVRDEYGEDYLDTLKDLHQKMLTSSSSDISPVLEDAHHALLAQRPYSTYTPGRLAYLIPLIFRCSPIWVYDTFAKLIFPGHHTILPRSLRTFHDNYKTDLKRGRGKGHFRTGASQTQRTSEKTAMFWIS